ncbi:MAG: cytochrome c biogenesis protein ResB, partial [Planctomycetota bacterium]
MASNPASTPSLTASLEKQNVSATDIARAILAPLASLKLTVFLLVMAVFVTWIVTLEQTTLDIWELKTKHFNSLWIFVPFKTFFPIKWFPNFPDINAGIILPSGYTIIVAMLINLTAAHVLRFRIQASGARLWLGILVLAASSYLTWAVIFNYQDANGFGGTPPIPWKTMWTYLQIVVLGLGIASIYSAMTLEGGRAAEKIFYWLSGATLGVLLLVSIYYGEQAFIGDSAMRIMWQLAQSTLSAMAVFVGCWLLFKRKAGIVLLHLGIAGLLANEIFVTMTNEEHRVSFAEGETVHHAVDLRETELVVIDRSDSEYDSMTVLPAELLKPGETIDDERFPFKITCLDYFENSDVLRVGPMADNKATKGFGKRFIAVDKTSTSGVEMGSGVDQASAYIKLTSRNGESLGVFLLSQAAYASSIVDTVEVEKNSTYQIGLRYKTIYTPYSMTLNDVKAEYYVGTETPKWFSSKVVINDEENAVKSEQLIWMNNPLRYRDQTFYQTNYQKLKDTELSVLQVVRNNGWMIPYVCCMFVVVGLVAQFQQSLTSYLSKPQKSKETITEEHDAPQVSILWRWGPTWLLVGFFGLYVASGLARSISPIVKKAKGSDIRLDLFGKIPVTKGGRVQPMDSYARNLTRQLCNREFVIDGLGNKQPAIRWLADLMFDPKAADDYQILRIEDMNVQNALGLPRRKGLKYTFAEIKEANETLVKQLIEAEKLPPEEINVFHKRLREVFHKSRIIMEAQSAFSGTKGRYSKDDLFERLEVASNLVESKTSMPFVIPTQDTENPWLPVSLLTERFWLESFAPKENDSTNFQLASNLIKADFAPRKPDLIKQKIIGDMMQYEDIVEGMLARFKLERKDELEEVLLRNWDLIPRDVYEDEMKDAEKFIDQRIDRWPFEHPREFSMVREVIDSIQTAASDASIDRAMVDNLLKLEPAYQDGDAEQFNSRVEKHLASVAAVAPVDWNPTSLATEISYNHFSPFYVATVLYVAAFMITIFSWMFMREPMIRAGFWM